MNVGTKIIMTMIIELPIPHAFPFAMLMYFKFMRKLDRSWTDDKRNSKKVLQEDYEDLYIGPEFVFDYRLGQIVAFTWVSFMYNIGMPVLFLIGSINFFMMYWIDKWLLLRFHKTPRNYDERTINFSLKYMKLAFLFHAVIGYLMISNKNVLTQNKFFDDIIEDESLSEHLKKYEVNKSDLKKADRLNSVHTTLFIIIQSIFLFGMAFGATLREFVFDNWKCKCRGDRFKDMEAISSDYYDVIHTSFLISEYERSHLDK